jgi:hypothetical protein
MLRGGQRVLAQLEKKGKTAVIPLKANRKEQRGCDKKPLQSTTPDRKLLRQT